MADLSLEFSDLVDRLKALGVLLSSVEDGQEEHAAHGAGLIVEDLGEELERLVGRLHSLEAKAEEPGEPNPKVRRLKD